MSEEGQTQTDSMWAEMGLTPEAIEQFLAWSRVQVFTQPDPKDLTLGIYYTGSTKALKGEQNGKLERAPAGDRYCG